MENHTFHVRDLSPGDRAVLERVIGHALHEDVHLMIQIIGADSALPSTLPTDDARSRVPEWSDAYASLSDEEVAQMRRESEAESS